MSAFITKWDIIGFSKKLVLPLIKSGTYDFYVDWGDGSPTSHITYYKRAWHRYPSIGVYEVCITGTIKGWKLMEKYMKHPRRGFLTPKYYQLIDVCQWGCLKLGDSGRYFWGCKRLQISATDAPDLSETTNLSDMFAFCDEFNSPIGHWDVSKVTNMNGLFHGAKSFNQPIASWNVSKVTNMGAMFSGASFNQPLNSWDVSNVTKMNLMFHYARCFNQPIESWNVSNVTDMGLMFDHASAFNQDISSWNVSNVTNMLFMFYHASAFNQDISSWNVSNVTNMLLMFLEATSFNDINRSKLGNWILKSPDVSKDIFGFGTILICRPKMMIEWSEYCKIHADILYSRDCSICLTDITDKGDWRAFRCHPTINKGIPHCFHKGCIEGWLVIHNTCPVCRGDAIR